MKNSITFFNFLKFSLSVALILSLTNAYSGGNNPVFSSFAAVSSSPQQDDVLKKQFKNYELYKFNPAAIRDYVMTEAATYRFDLKFGQHSWDLSLEPFDIRSEDYVLRVATDKGIIDMPRSANVIYRGIVNNDPARYGIFVISENEFSAIIKDAETGKEIYIEPAKRYDASAAEDLFIVFKTKDLNYNPEELQCGTEEDIHSIVNNIPQKNENNTQNQVCKMAEYGIGCDYATVTKYGGVAGTETELLATMAWVQQEYDLVEILYKVGTIFIPASASADPFWPSETDMDVLLPNCNQWVNSGKLGTVDLSTIWLNRQICSTRNGSCGVAGRATLCGVCSSNKTNVLEAMHNRAIHHNIQAHENGHNWCANHTQQGDGTIMQPSVDPNANGWAQVSKNEIAQGAAKSCISGCNVAPVANFSANLTSGCGSLAVQFTDQSTNNPTSWSWDFGDGTSSTQQNPQHTYSQAGNYTVKLTATNTNGQNTQTKTNYIAVGQGVPYALVTGAAPDTAMGGGGFIPAARSMFFNAKENIVIDKVTIYSDQSASIPVQIYTSANLSIYSNSFSVPAGKSEITLGARVTMGNGYYIKAEGGTLYRNNAGVSFPYTVGTMVDITGTDASANPGSYYYFFYNWKVRKDGCTMSTSIAEIEESIRIYPNPASGNLTLELSYTGDNAASVELHSVLGGLIQSQTISLKSGINKQQLDISGLPSGVYFLKLNINDAVIQKKIIKL